jgi:hypothetical protein
MTAIAALLPTDLGVEPGSQVTATIRVRNTGAIVDRFAIDIVGVTDWARVDPPALSLFPGAEESATITFAPPRGSLPRAGTFPFGVRVRPDADPAASTVEEGRITVAPFVALAAEIAPQTSRGARAGHHQVVVENRGNTPADVGVAAIDPDRRLSITVTPARALVAPDAATGFGVRVQVDDPFPFGASRPRPFVATVHAAGQAPLSLSASLSQQALMPSWIPRLAAVAMAVVAVVGGAFFFGLGPFAPRPAPTPQVALVTPVPTEQPPAPTQGLAEPAEPTETPTPTPTPTESPTPAPLRPRDFDLAVTGDNGELGASLTLACKPDQDACRRAAKEDILAMISGLQNEYTGVGITSSRSTSAPNSLPVVLSAEREFPWRQVNDAQTGITTTAVIDLGPLLASPVGPAYAVMNTPDGIPHRFVVDGGLAQQLFNRLYQLPPEMPPVEAPTPLSDITVGVYANPIWELDWLQVMPLLSPAPGG